MPNEAGCFVQELFAIGHPPVTNGHFQRTAVPSEDVNVIDEDYCNTSAGTWYHSDGGLTYNPSIFSNSVRMLRVWEGERATSAHQEGLSTKTTAIRAREPGTTATEV